MKFDSALDKISVVTDIAEEVLEFFEKHGIKGITDLLDGFNKDEITVEDWKMLIDKFEKTPEDYLKEAKEELEKESQ